MVQVTAGEAAQQVHPLDDVVGNALASRQHHLAIGNEHVRRYPSDVAPFASMADFTPASFDTLHTLVEQHGPAALVTTQELAHPSSFSVVWRTTLLQMIWQGKPDSRGDIEHVTLNGEDVPEMLQLTAATQPGPFSARTIEMGRYIGVRSQGRLAAMAGERLKPNGFTEISAVCVDPDFRGKGLSTGLMRVLIAEISARGETPFLHVLESNYAAIKIYEALGFVVRRAMHLTVLGAAST